LKSEIESRAKFDMIRYSQVWEDADLLIEALNISNDDTVLSIASAGDNAFALLAQNPEKVYAVDLSFAQIACCELRKAMYRQLNREDHMLFGGVTDGEMDRLSTLKRLDLPQNVKEYWENNPDTIEKGFMTQGKFEHYFKIFREKAMPLVHTRRKIEDLLSPKTEEQRCEFYDKVWNNRRWRMMFAIFFSRFTMGRLGRDKEFFTYVDGSVANRILARSKHALTKLDTSKNPYLHYILNGKYEAAFPYSLREENYKKIQDNLDRIGFRQLSIENFAAEYDGEINAFNLSDIFEYMTIDSMNKLYETMLQKSAKNARFAYWNMLAPRKCEATICDKYAVETDEDKNAELLMKDKAFFYSKFYLDIVRGND